MPRTPGQLLQHLPGIYHASQDLRSLLSVFEEVLLGSGADGCKGLEQKIASISRLFDPDPRLTSTDLSSPGTPGEFLPWLARWVALVKYQGLPERQLRKLIARIVPLYACRGTKAYLEEMLRFFLPEHAAITIYDQDLAGLAVGSSRLGLDSWLGRDRPFWFRVEIRSPLTTIDPEQREKLREDLKDRARLVIDLAKPAHTAYQLEWAFADSSEKRG